MGVIQAESPSEALGGSYFRLPRLSVPILGRYGVHPLEPTVLDDALYSSVPDLEFTRRAEPREAGALNSRQGECAFIMNLYLSILHLLLRRV